MWKHGIPSTQKEQGQMQDFKNLRRKSPRQWRIRRLGRRNIPTGELGGVVSPPLIFLYIGKHIFNVPRPAYISMDIPSQLFPVQGGAH